MFTAANMHRKNFLKYFVFASFFPHIVQGPIDRYDTLAPRLYEGNKWNFDNIKTGVMLIVWGYFKKLIIADRLAPAVNTIFSEYTSYGGPMIFFGTVLFFLFSFMPIGRHIAILSAVRQKCSALKLRKTSTDRIFRKTCLSSGADGICRWVRFLKNMFCTPFPLQS